MVHDLVIMGHELSLLYLRASFSMQKAANLHSFWWHHASLHSLQHQPQWDLFYNKNSSAGQWDATLKVPESCETYLAPSEPWRTLIEMKAPMHFKSLLGATDFHLLTLSVAIIKYCHVCNQTRHTSSSEAAKALCRASTLPQLFSLEFCKSRICKLLRNKRKAPVLKKIALEN